MTLRDMNAAMESLPVELLYEILHLDAETGLLTWLERPAAHFPNGKPSPDLRAGMWNGKYAGREALTSADPRGYRRGQISGVWVYAHRVVRAMADGAWPDGEVDHINRDKTDNRPGNLRVVTHAENRRNTPDCERRELMRGRARK